jgi:hypothetical protein
MEFADGPKYGPVILLEEAAGLLKGVSAARAVQAGRGVLTLGPPYPPDNPVTK